ncbi:MAG: acyltransferase family protein [Hyphomicrobiaceae bacterium]
MRYRPDVDGLRAVSVLLVLLFHLGIAAVPGGFVGVDVFFVISGFLITGIILAAVEDKKFSLLWFYERRIRRIFPALCAVLAASLAAGYVLLTPGDYGDLALSALSTIAAVPNIYFFKHTGYFDAAAEFRPLLHMWSLGVEEQFYFVWPALLWLVARRQDSGWRLKALVTGVTIISFALSAVMVYSSPKSAYYLPHLRAWELGVGAWIAIATRHAPPRVPRWTAEVATAAGLALIVAGALVLTRNDPFPGFNGLYPVLGAALVIFPWGRVTGVARLLSLPPVVLLGKLSYSLYLWHWPMIVFWREYTNSETIEPGAQIAIGIGATVLAWLSWRLVEQPFRGRNLNRRTLFVVSGAGAAVVASATAVIALTGGLPGRVPESVKAIASREIMWDWKCPHSRRLGISRFDKPELQEVNCVVGESWDKARSHALIWGDSNTLHWLPELDRAARSDHQAVVVVNPCPPFIKRGGVEEAMPAHPKLTYRCSAMRASVIETLRKHPEIKTVLMSARWTNHSKWLHMSGEPPRQDNRTNLALLRRGLDDLLVDMPADRRIVLMAEIPVVPVANLAGCVVAQHSSLWRRPCDIDLDKAAAAELAKDVVPISKVLKAAAALHPNVTVYAPHEILCHGTRCTTVVNGEFIYRDKIHLRRNLRPDT